MPEGTLYVNLVDGLLFEHAPVALVITELDEQGEVIVVAANRLAAQGLGVDVERVRGVPLREIDAEAAALWAEKHRESQRNGRPATFETAGPSGTVLAVTIGEAGCSPSGRRWYGVISVDVTHIKLTENELARALDRFRALIGGMPDTTGRLDRSGRILDVNAPRTRPPVRPRSQLLGRRIRELVDATVADAVEGAIARALDSDDVTSYEFEHCVGERRHVLEMRFVRSGPEEVIAVSREVTALRELERRLVESERLASLGMLAASTAYQITDPLANISSSVSEASRTLARLRDDLPPTSDLHGELQQALRSLATAQRGASRVGEVLEWLKEYAGPAADVADPKLRARAKELRADAALARLRILIIDDEPFVTTVLGRILSEEHEVVVEHSAQRALELVRTGQRYDVILCDLTMPVLDGMAFYEALAADTPEQARHMAFVTGGAVTRRTEDFLRRCGQPVLTKPFRRAGVLAVVRQAAFRA